MTDKYIIYRKPSKWDTKDPLGMIAYYTGTYGGTLCWSVQLSDAKVFSSYKDADTTDIPLHRKYECGIDLHPESRYEQT